MAPFNPRHGYKVVLLMNDGQRRSYSVPSHSEREAINRAFKAAGKDNVKQVLSVTEIHE